MRKLEEYLEQSRRDAENARRAIETARSGLEKAKRDYDLKMTAFEYKAITRAQEQLTAAEEHAVACAAVAQEAASRVSSPELTEAIAACDPARWLRESRDDLVAFARDMAKAYTSHAVLMRWIGHWNDAVRHRDEVAKRFGIPLRFVPDVHPMTLLAIATRAIHDVVERCGERTWMHPAVASPRPEGKEIVAEVEAVAAEVVSELMEKRIAT